MIESQCQWSNTRIAKGIIQRRKQTDKNHIAIFDFNMGGGPAEKYPQPGKPYGGFVPPQPKKMHTRIGYAFGVTMWLWIFYRSKQDLPHLLGFEKPWEHAHHDDHDHDTAPTH